MVTLRRKIMTGYAACVAVLMVFGVLTFVVLGLLIETLRQRAEQREVMLQLNGVLSALQDAETSQRGYVLTGRTEYLEPLETAKSRLPGQLSRLESLAARGHGRADVRELKDRVQQKMDYVEGTVKTRRDQGFEAATAMVATGEGKLLMDQVRRQIEVMRSREDAVFARLVATTEDRVATLRGLILFGIPTLVAGLISLGLYLSNHIATPVAELTREAARIQHGDLSSPLPRSQRRDEVGELQRTFETMRGALDENRRQLLDRNETLSALNNQLEDLTQAKSEFLAMMSHEIRTPLHGLIGYSNLLSETPLTEQQQDYLATIRASGKSLLTVINDVLDFSKIEAGKLEIEREVFDISRCLRETCELFRPAAMGNGTTLEWHVDPALPVHVLGDSTRLRQVLANLVSNAVKFTRNGRVVVRAARRGLSEGEDFLLEVSVADSGIGIPREKREQLFHSFNQLGAATARKHGGTGLGLAISKRLCELMGGGIRVDDMVNQGTTFHFTVRLRPASKEDLAAEGALPLQAAEALDDALLRGSRVLVAEDNPVNASLLSLYLKKHGLACEVAVNGRKAVERALQFDLIFMDIQMPEMDGIEATRAIRKLPGGASPYIIALTAEAMKGDAERCLNAGMDDYLTKPFKPRDLDLALAKYCIVRGRRAS